MPITQQRDFRISCGVPTRVGREGYTLVETVVALFIFSIGTLSLAGGGALLTRQMEHNAIVERARRTASSRLEVLESQCAQADGHEAIGAVESAWTVTPLSFNVAQASVSVSYPSREGRRTETYRAAFACSL
ncbi:MAG: prepilin-type N-terminal cleavage/methylation domain-containing protein [Gemmatimonadaceae bacterium]